jgi:hypothetical protein
MISPYYPRCPATAGMARPFARRAFVAARSRSPSIQKCSELKPPEHLGTANIQPFRQFLPRLPFLSSLLDFFRSVLRLPHSPCLMRAFVRFQRPGELMLGWS